MKNTKLNIIVLIILLALLVLTFKNQKNNRRNIENVIKTIYNTLFLKKLNKMKLFITKIKFM